MKNNIYMKITKILSFVILGTVIPATVAYSPYILAVVYKDYMYLLGLFLSMPIGFKLAFRYINNFKHI